MTITAAASTGGGITRQEQGYGDMCNHRHDSHTRLLAPSSSKKNGRVTGFTGRCVDRAVDLLAPATAVAATIRSSRLAKLSPSHPTIARDLRYWSFTIKAVQDRP